MNYLYKLVTTENVEINYDTFKKKELIECLVTMRDIYFSFKKENQQFKINCNIGNENLNFYREEYKKLKDNWNKLKKYINEETILQFYNDKLPFEIIVEGILNKMQELERGASDER